MFDNNIKSPTCDTLPVLACSAVHDILLPSFSIMHRRLNLIINSKHHIYSVTDIANSQGNSVFGSDPTLHKGPSEITL